MGRLPLGPDHRFGWWEGNIWSSAQSQRVADPYSFSHIVHGVLFYALLWVFARRWPIETRLLVAVALELLLVGRNLERVADLATAFTAGFSAGALAVALRGAAGAAAGASCAASSPTFDR